MSPNPDKETILVVEDEHHVAEGIKLNLNLAGYEVEVAESGTAAVSMYRDINPDLIVLDLMLPGMDGFSVLRHIRLENDRIPILILSAKGDVEDKIRGLAFGVDDYLAKPFNLQEFLLRVKRLLTRSAWQRQAGPVEEEKPGPTRFGGNEVDLENLTAKCIQGDIRLSGQEAKILKIFFQNPGKPLPRRDLLEIGWGYSQKTSTRTLDNFMVRLRKYFEENPKKPRFFKSIRSVGYLFDPKGD